MVNEKIFFGILGIGVFCLFLVLAGAISLNGKFTDCYDKHDNKIIGQRCIVENSFDTQWEAYLMLGFLGAAIGVIFFLLGDTLDKFKEIVDYD